MIAVLYNRAVTWIEVCTRCGRNFSVTEIGGTVGIADRESIGCPYCNTVVKCQKSSGVFKSEKLPER